MKKIICLIIILANILFITASADTIYLTETAKNDLYNFKIMTGDENGDLRLNDNITRAEFCKMICVAGSLGISHPTQTDEIIFNDVDFDHWAYKYISSAKASAVINGDENGNFNPENNITNEEIVKMLVCVLGYGEMAEMRGGYPAGYTAVASQIGITNGLKLKMNTPAFRNDVAIMIINSLDIPVMQITSFGENTEFSIMNGENNMPSITLRKRLANKF